MIKHKLIFIFFLNTVFCFSQIKIFEQNSDNVSLVGKISHTVRTEAIEEDLSPVLVALGIAPSFNTDHASMSDQDTWMERYNTGATSMMIDRYGWDMAQFGYVAPRFRHAA